MKLSNEIITALDRLNSKGHEAFCIGGCVRDTIMGITPHDYDITTSASPEEILECFSDHRCLTVGIKHGTVTVLINNEPIEITTYRIDGEYKDSRHPDNVIFTKELRKDTSRRDFTVNAIAYSPSTGYIDNHNGIKDIENRLIRCVGEPKKRFTEDALRILRALRFASTLGFEIERNTAEAIHSLKHLLNNIAAERIYAEFTKLICGKDARRILTDFHDVIEIFIPEISPMVGFEQNNIHHCYDVYTHTLVSLESIAPEPLLRWTMLLHDIGKPHCYTEDERGGHFYGHYKISAEIAKAVLKRLKASREMIEHTALLVYRHDALIPITERSIRRILMKLGEKDTFLLFEINRADAKAQAKHQIAERLERTDMLEAKTKEIISKNECFSKKSLAISGKDLIALGVPEGRKIGIVIDRLLNEVVDQKTVNIKSALLKRAFEIYKEL